MDVQWIGRVFSVLRVMLGDEPREMPLLSRGIGDISSGVMSGVKGPT